MKRRHNLIDFTQPEAEQLAKEIYRLSGDGFNFVVFNDNNPKLVELGMLLEEIAVIDKRNEHDHDEHTTE